MGQREIEIGDAIACRDEATGQSGVLHVEADRVWVEFVGFGKRPEVDSNSSICLHTAKGWVVSLFRNVDVSSVMPFWRRSEVATVYEQRIVANLAIAGVTEWRLGDKARSVTFRMGAGCDFLWPTDRAREIAQVSIDAMPDRTVFISDVAGGRISMELALEEDPLRNKWTPTEPWLTLHFDDGAEPDECIARVYYLVSMFSLLTWRDLQVEEIALRHTSAQPNTPMHRVVLAGTERTSVARSGKLVPISADSEVAREALKAALRIWLDRQSVWDSATGLMLAALRRFRNVSAERALDACRWHEVLESVAPDSKGKAPAGMEEVVAAALKVAQEKELTPYLDWINSLLRGVKGVPRRDRFKHLTERINAHFDTALFDEEAVTMIMRAYKARNKTGHGAMGPLADRDAQQLWADTMALESLCALRMLTDLPIPPEGLQWLRMHPLVHAFQQIRKQLASSSKPDN